MFKNRFLKNLNQIKRIGFGFLSKLTVNFGYFLIEDDYYCPIPNKKILAEEVERWWKPSEMVGVNINVKKMETILQEIHDKYEDYLENLPDYDKIVEKGFGPGFGLIDGLLLTGMVRYLKPNHVIEIGSGISTFYGTYALESNGKGIYTCIEPYPYSALTSLPNINQIIKERVETLDYRLFEELKENDILFIDSSHTVKLGGDIVYLYLEVLPRLNKGVVVHIHDIAFPYPIWTPEQVITGNRKWTEYAIVQAFLINNEKFEIMVSTSYLHFKHPELLEKTINTYKRTDRPPVSLWLRKL